MKCVADLLKSFIGLSELPSLVMNTRDSENDMLLAYITSYVMNPPVTSTDTCSPPLSTLEVNPDSGVIPVFWWNDPSYWEYDELSVDCR